MDNSKSIKFNNKLLKLTSIVITGVFVFNTTFIDIAWAEPKSYLRVVAIEENPEKAGILEEELAIRGRLPDYIQRVNLNAQETIELTNAVESYLKFRKQGKERNNAFEQVRDRIDTKLVITFEQTIFGNMGGLGIGFLNFKKRQKEVYAALKEIIANIVSQKQKSNSAYLPIIRINEGLFTGFIYDHKAKKAFEETLSSLGLDTSLASAVASEFEKTVEAYFPRTIVVDNPNSVNRFLDYLCERYGVEKQVEKQRDDFAGKGDPQRIFGILKRHLEEKYRANKLMNTFHTMGYWRNVFEQENAQELFTDALPFIEKLIAPALAKYDSGDWQTGRDLIKPMIDELNSLSKSSDTSTRSASAKVIEEEMMTDRKVNLDYTPYPQHPNLTPWEVLELAQSKKEAAVKTITETKKARRELILKHHPDFTPNNDKKANEKIKKINWAYEELTKDKTPKSPGISSIGTKISHEKQREDIAKKIDAAKKRFIPKEDLIKIAKQFNIPVEHLENIEEIRIAVNPDFKTSHIGFFDYNKQEGDNIKKPSIYLKTEVDLIHEYLELILHLNEMHRVNKLDPEEYYSQLTPQRAEEIHQQAKEAEFAQVCPDIKLLDNLRPEIISALKDPVYRRALVINHRLLREPGFALGLYKTFEKLGSDKRKGLRLVLSYDAVGKEKEVKNFYKNIEKATGVNLSDNFFDKVVSTKEAPIKVLQEVGKLYVDSIEVFGPGDWGKPYKDINETAVIEDIIVVICELGDNNKIVQVGTAFDTALEAFLITEKMMDDDEAMHLNRYNEKKGIFEITELQEIAEEYKPYIKNARDITGAN